MEQVVFAAERRDVIGKHVKSLRREGKLPAILYGKHFAPIPVIMDQREVSRTLAHLPQSALVAIEMAGEKHIGLVREKQRDHLTGELLHVDFQVVSMAEKIRTRVAISLIGEAPAVKAFSGIVVPSLDELEVECLPQYLPEVIEVNISGLNEIGDSIHVRDLNLSDEMRVMDDEDVLIVVVTAQAAEEVEEGGAGAAEPEVIEKGKREEEF